MIETEYSGTATKFFKDVINASIPGGMESDSLRSWVKKTSGYMEGGDLSQGGYSIPSPLSNVILERALERSIVRPRATLQPMTSRTLAIPSDVDSNHAAGVLFGGVTIYRPGELGQKTPTNPKMGKVNLQLHTLAGLVYVSDELLEDSGIAMEAYLIRKFSQAIAFYEDNDFLNGTGANMALGAFNPGNPSLITVDAVGGQGAGTIIAENIADMWARLYPDGQSNAAFLANINTFRQLFSMGIAVGAGGVPVWMPANNVADKPYSSLMGRPLIFTEKMQSLGTAGDIGLADFSQYLVGDRNGGAPQVASSIHIKFDFDETAFRFVLRYDGQPSWLSTLTPLNGTETLSPFIRLSGTRT
jgi:HK97 family phage major capsid protein